MPQSYEVPAGTSASRCRAESCRAEIFWIETPAGKKLPIDCGPKADGVTPTETRAGRGVPHWATCPAADSFRRRKS